MSTITVALPSQAAWNSKPPYVKLQAYESDRSPGIEAKFSLDKYLLREAMLAAKTRTKPSLPHVFPQQIDSPAVWSPSTLDLHAITYHVSSKDKEELETALERFKGKFCCSTSPIISSDSAKNLRDTSIPSLLNRSCYLPSDRDFVNYLGTYMKERAPSLSGDFSLQNTVCKTTSCYLPGYRVTLEIREADKAPKMTFLVRFTENSLKNTAANRASSPSV